MTNNIVEVTQDTFNTVLISMLKGATEAGKEIYVGSKETVVKAIDFAQEQSPLIVKEFLSWQMANSILHIIACVLGLIIFGFLWKKLFKLMMADEDGSDPWVFFLVFCTVLLLIISYNFFGHISDLVKLYIAPRIYLIEWVTSQIKK